MKILSGKNLYLEKKRNQLGFSSFIQNRKETLLRISKHNALYVKKCVSTAVSLFTSEKGNYRPLPLTETITELKRHPTYLTLFQFSKEKKYRTYSPVNRIRY